MDSVQICNLALMMAGIPPITSFQDENNNAKQCKTFSPFCVTGFCAITHGVLPVRFMICRFWMKKVQTRITGLSAHCRVNSFAF